MSEWATYRKLDRLDLALELARLVRGHAAGDDRARHAAGAAEGDFRGDKDVGHVLVLAQQGQVQHDLNRLDVRGHHNELADTTVERLGRLVRTLLQLLVVRSLLHQIKDLVGKRSIGEGEGLGVHFGLGHLDLTTSDHRSAGRKKSRSAFCPECT